MRTRMPLPPNPKQPGTKQPGVIKKDGSIDEMLDLAVPEVLSELYSIAMNGDGETTKSQQLKAIEMLLDRGLGKATQHIDVTHDTKEILERIEQGRGPVIDG